MLRKFRILKIIVILICIVLVVILTSRYQYTQTTTTTTTTTKIITANIDVYAGDEVKQGNALKSILLTKSYKGKLLTQFTTFIDVTDGTNEEDNYRRITQTNYLQTTTFPQAKAQTNYVIYTNCKYWINLIQTDYQHMHVLPLRRVHQSQPPLLKHMVIDTMDTFDTPFYMYANSDNLYDSSLTTTITTILNNIQSGVMRQKLLLIGHRSNVKISQKIQSETEVKELKEISQANKPFAKDYAIFTRESYDWNVFPDLMIGRTFFDSYLVDYAFHNEIQTVDVTATIPLVHQVKRLGFSTGMHANVSENEWNKSIYGVKNSHSSILCSEFRTAFSNNKVVIYDKAKQTFLATNGVTRFDEDYNNILRQIHESIRSKYPKDSVLTIVITTQNKPASLARLLTVLNNAINNNNNKNNIDLVISVNKGRTDLYDIDTLKQLMSCEWTHGHKLLHLTPTHLTNIQHWLDVDTVLRDNTPLLILQDDVTLSPHFYTVLTRAVSYVSWTERVVGGISLEPPLSFPPDSKVYMKLTASYHDNLVLSQPMSSRALYPNPVIWREFSKWAREATIDPNFNTKQLFNTFAASNINFGDKTEWYVGMAGVWFGYFLEKIGSNMGYLMHPRGVIATWEYRGLEGTENFLGYDCSFKNVEIKTQIPILTHHNPVFRFNSNPPIIHIEKVKKLY